MCFGIGHYLPYLKTLDFEVKWKYSKVQNSLLVSYVCSVCVCVITGETEINSDFSFAFCTFHVLINNSDKLTFHLSKRN